MTQSLSQNELDRLINYSRNLNLAHNSNLDDKKDLYHSLPLCVTDAVFSINAKYESTLKVVERLAKYAGYPFVLEDEGDEPTLEAFLTYFDVLGSERMAREVFQNRQRTSTSGGILKAEAVERFARTLSQNGINQRQDVVNADHHALKEAIISIPGQRSGISLRYFYMLLGDYDYVKPDRHIMNFVSAAIGRTLDVAQCHEAIVATAQALQGDFPHITPRSLDGRIWNYQRSQ